LEVITEITSQHYVVFVILAIISTGIVSAIIFKKIQKYKRYQFHKNHALNTDVNKIENALKHIQRHVDEYQNGDARNKDMVIMTISAIVHHQLGHIPRMRSWLE
jgi:hypothetical protein